MPCFHSQQRFQIHSDWYYIILLSSICCAHSRRCNFQSFQHVKFKQIQILSSHSRRCSFQMLSKFALLISERLKHWDQGCLSIGTRTAQASWWRTQLSRNCFKEGMPSTMTSVRWNRIGTVFFALLEYMHPGFVRTTFILTYYYCSCLLLLVCCASYVVCLSCLLLLCSEVQLPEQWWSDGFIEAVAKIRHERPSPW